MREAVGRRLRTAAALLLLAELLVYVLVATWIGIGWTILATLATSALGFALVGRQGTKTLTDLRERAQSRRPAGRELGDAGLVAAGGLLMILPGFIGDLVGLLCLLPVTRGLVRGLLTRVVLARAPGLRGPVRVESVRTATVDAPFPPDNRPLVIEGEIVRDPDGRPLT
jgi:UPF0716 protein FxsA